MYIYTNNIHDYTTHLLSYTLHINHIRKVKGQNYDQM